jgi:flavin-dependent dehydrogenase
MVERFSNPDPFVLADGSSIAVIGGGPTGSFFSIFALKMAKMIGKEISLTIYEPKEFSKDGPAGCNRCGGIISELLVQLLAVEGINLPDSVVQKGINSYNLHTNQGSVFIKTPTLEKTIATVYRGGGPKGIVGQDKESFDNFLLRQAIDEGAVHQALKIDKIAYHDHKPVIFSKDKKVQEADLVVGAFGVNSATTKLFQEIGFGYLEPLTITTAIAEIGFDPDVISHYFGNSINLFLLPEKDIKFAAIIPKETYVTVCLLGKNITADTVTNFLDYPVVRQVLPEHNHYKLNCRCLPKMNIKAPQKPFADRMVICGDAGSTRLFKDGLGAAYLMGKAAARTAVFQGVGARHFGNDYYPVYQSLITDNHYGQLLYSAIDLFRKNQVLSKVLLQVVRKEQKSSEQDKRLSEILWDMFTGNERYKNVFFRALSFKMNVDLCLESAKILFKGGI